MRPPRSTQRWPRLGYVSLLCGYGGFLWSHIQGTTGVGRRGLQVSLLSMSSLHLLYCFRTTSSHSTASPDSWLRFVLLSVLLLLVPFHSVLSSFLCLDSTWSLLWLWSGVVRGGLRRLRSRRVLASSALVSRCDFPSLVIRGARRAGGAWDWFLYLVPIEPWLCFSTTISGPGVAVVQYGRARVWA